MRCKLSVKLSDLALLQIDTAVLNRQEAISESGYVTGSREAGSVTRHTLYLHRFEFI